MADFLLLDQDRYDGIDLFLVQVTDIVKFQLTACLEGQCCFDYSQRRVGGQSDLAMPAVVKQPGPTVRFIADGASPHTTNIAGRVHSVESWQHAGPLARLGMQRVISLQEKLSLGTGV